MANKLGHEGQLLIAPTPTGAFSAMNQVQDATLTVNGTEIDITTRANQGWGAVRLGLKKFSISGQLLYDPNDTTWTTLRNAFLNGTQIGIQVLDGASGNGFKGPARVTSWERAEPIDAAMTCSFTIASDGKPDWIGI